MGIPSVVGAFIGGFYGGLVPSAFLLVAVGLLGCWYGYALQTSRCGGRRPRRDIGPTVAEDGSPVTSFAIHVSVRRGLRANSLGFAVGLLGGMVGLGLWQLRLPTMLQVLGMDPRIAVGTSLAIGALTAGFAFLGRVLPLQVDLTVLVILGPMAMLVAFLGAKQTGKMSPQTVRRLMGSDNNRVSAPLLAGLRTTLGRHNDSFIHPQKLRLTCLPGRPVNDRTVSPLVQRCIKPVTTFKITLRAGA